MKNILIAAMVVCAAAGGCAVPTAQQVLPVCPPPRDMSNVESLKHYTIHVLNLYNMCRDATLGRRDEMPVTDTLQDDAEVKK